jgi:hypothetical protein
MQASQASVQRSHPKLRAPYAWQAAAPGTTAAAAGSSGSARHEEPPASWRRVCGWRQRLRLGGCALAAGAAPRQRACLQTHQRVGAPGTRLAVRPRAARARQRGESPVPCFLASPNGNLCRCGCSYSVHTPPRGPTGFARHPLNRRRRQSAAPNKRYERRSGPAASPRPRASTPETWDPAVGAGPPLPAPCCTDA